MFQLIRSWFRHSGLHPFPLYHTLSDYSFRKAGADLRAALNVALLDFPQGMAYALIAGLPVQTSIYCSAVSSITGPCLASSRFVMLGPTNATAVMLLSTFLTLGYTPEQSMLPLPLLLLLVSIFMIGGAFLSIANITQYISRAVVIGYISAAACLIIVNQLKTVLGLHVPRSGTVAESFTILIAGIRESQWESLTIATLTLALYLPLKRWAKGLPTVAITLIGTSLITTALATGYGIEVEMLHAIAPGSWHFGVPQINLSDFAGLANAALAIAFLSLLESSSIAKTLAAQSGDRVNLNQHMLSTGVANLADVFSGGMAVSGSLTRSVLNFRSGAKTIVSSIFSGVLLGLGLLLFGKYIGYIPKPALPVLVIAVGVSLINLPNIRVMLKTTRRA
jgi:SulP family sulfate permease